jgi:hypothetical protein
MKYGYRDESGEFIETPRYVNAVFPEMYKHGIFCSCCQKYLFLKPVSLDYEATHWEDNCTCISLKAINQCFNNCHDTFINLYNLKTLSYDIQNRNWKIESAEFIGESRVNSPRKIITMDVRKDILSDLKNAVQDQLAVEFEDWTDYFYT